MNRVPFDPYDIFGYLASGLLLIAGMDLIIGFPNVLGRDLKTTEMILLVFAIYVGGQLVATPAKAILEDLIVEKILGRPSINLLRKKKPWIRWFLFPEFYKPLPKEIQDRIRTRATSEKAPPMGEPFFLFVRYHADILCNEKLLARLDTFLSRYGFARNLAFTSLLVGVGLLVKAWRTADLHLLQYGWTALVVGVLLFYRYLKFFRQYSYELFNTYSGLK